MRKFRVTVNSTTYEVEVEEVGGEQRPAAAPVATPVRPAAPAPSAPAAAPTQAAPAAAAPAAAPRTPSAGGVQVKAPLPGVVLSIKVKPGDAVRRGGLLLILEAMKMENEILASQDGTVREILVSSGASVNTGDVLVVLD
ncbi:MAG: acetyl-CoA carboxylase biotin carboxyl carrier protein subunit [Chloroflexota bacterium]